MPTFSTANQPRPNASQNQGQVQSPINPTRSPLGQLATQPGIQGGQGTSPFQLQAAQPQQQAAPQVQLMPFAQQLGPNPFEQQAAPPQGQFAFQPQQVQGFAPNAFAQQFGQQTTGLPTPVFNTPAQRNIGTSIGESPGFDPDVFGTTGGSVRPVPGGQSTAQSVQPGTQLNFDTQRDLGFADVPFTTNNPSNPPLAQAMPLINSIAPQITAALEASGFASSQRVAMSNQVSNFVNSALIPALTQGTPLPTGETVSTTGDIARAITNFTQGIVAQEANGNFMLVFQQPQGSEPGRFEVLNLTQSSAGPPPTDNSILDFGAPRRLRFPPPAPEPGSVADVQARQAFPDITPEELVLYNQVFSTSGPGAAANAVANRRAQGGSVDPNAGADPNARAGRFGPGEKGLLGGGGTPVGHLLSTGIATSPGGQERRSAIRGILGQNIHNLDLQQFGIPRDLSLFDDSLGSLRGDITQRGSLANLRNLNTPITPGAFSQLTQGAQLDPTTNEVVPGQFEQLMAQFFGAANQSGQLSQDLGAAGLGTAAQDFLTGAPGTPENPRELTLEESGRVARVFEEQGYDAAVALESQLSQGRGASIFDTGQGSLDQAFSVDPTLTGGLQAVGGADDGSPTSFNTIQQRVQTAQAAHGLQETGITASMQRQLVGAEAQLGRKLTQQEMDTFVSQVARQPDLASMERQGNLVLSEILGTPLDDALGASDLFGGLFDVGTGDTATNLQQALQRGAVAEDGGPSEAFQQLVGEAPRTEPLTEIERSRIQAAFDRGDVAEAQRLSQFFGTRSGATLDLQNLRNLGQAGAEGTAGVDTSIEAPTGQALTQDRLVSRLQELNVPGFTGGGIAQVIQATEQGLGRSITDAEIDAAARQARQFLQANPGETNAFEVVADSLRALAAGGVDSSPARGGLVRGIGRAAEDLNLTQSNFAQGILGGPGQLGGLQALFQQARGGPSGDVSVTAPGRQDSLFGVNLTAQGGSPSLAQQIANNAFGFANQAQEARAVGAGSLSGQSTPFGQQIFGRGETPGLAGEAGTSAGAISGGSVSPGAASALQFGVNLGPQGLGGDQGLAAQARGASGDIGARLLPSSGGLGTELFGQQFADLASGALDAQTGLAAPGLATSAFGQDIDPSNIQDFAQRLADAPTQLPSGAVGATLRSGDLRVAANRANQFAANIGDAADTNEARALFGMSLRNADALQQQLQAQALGIQTQAGERAENALFQDIERQIQRINQADPFQAGARGIAGSGVAAGLLGEQAGGLLQALSSQVAQQRFAGQQAALQQLQALQGQLGQQALGQAQLGQQGGLGQAQAFGNIFGQQGELARSDAALGVQSGLAERQLAQQGLLGAIGAEQGVFNTLAGAAGQGQQLGLQAALAGAAGQAGLLGQLGGLASEQAGRATQASGLAGQLDLQAQLGRGQQLQGLLGQLGGFSQADAARQLQASQATQQLGLQGQLGQAQAQNQLLQNIGGLQDAQANRDFQANALQQQLRLQAQLGGTSAQNQLLASLGGLQQGQAAQQLAAAQSSAGNLLQQQLGQSQALQGALAQGLGAAQFERAQQQQARTSQLGAQQNLFNTLFGGQQAAQAQNRALQAQQQQFGQGQDFQRQLASAQLGLQQQQQQFGQQLQGTQAALQGGLQTAQIGDAAAFQRDQQGFQERLASQQALLGQQAQQASLNTQRAIAQGDLQTARTQLGQQATQFQQGLVQQSELQAQQLQEQARQFGLQGRADLQQQAIQASLQMSAMAQQGRQFVQQANQQQTNIAREQIAQFSAEFQRQDITADQFTEQVRSGRFAEQMSAMQFMFQQAATREGLSQQARSQVQGAIQALTNFENEVASTIQNQQLVDTQVQGPSTLDNILAVGNTLANVAGAFIPG